MSKFQTVEPEIFDYDTDYLDGVDGSVTDLVPTSAKSVPTLYQHSTQSVPANLVLPERQPTANPLAGALSHLMAPQASNGQQDAYAIQHMRSMSEKSTPMDRNKAKLILTAGWIAIAGIIAVGLHKADLIDDRMGWIIFVVAFVYGVYKSNADENAHSPAGVERHKTDIYGKIRFAEIKAADKANERNHETFGKVLDQVYGGGDRVQNRITRQR
jgi:hypothetical protein